MTDREALLRAVLLSPADDTPRLVFADWLDETGQPERAELIRVQCELDTLVPCSAFMYSCYEHGPRCLCGSRRQLQEQEKKLLDQHWLDWCPEMTAASRYTQFNHDGEWAWDFRRGFVSEVRLPLESFFGSRCHRCHGWADFRDALTADGRCRDCRGVGGVPGLAADLFAAHPITRVVATDRRPARHPETLISSYGFTHVPDAEWEPGYEPWVIPWCVWQLLPDRKWTGDDPAAAADFLSHALVRLGRRRAAEADPLLKPLVSLPA